jgi:teichuronic acid biosynthesis glycosyltransferase TuaG
VAGSRTDEFKMRAISLIIVAYEDRGWLDDAIESAKSQTFHDYEIILVSDGNPKLECYAKKHNIDFVLSPKKNWSACFNKAVRGCCGEFVKWLDDDDLLTPNCLKDLYYNIKNNDVIYANAINFSRDSEVNYRSPAGLGYDDFLPLGQHIGTNKLHGGTVLIRKKSFLKVGGADEKLNKVEEYDLWLNLLSHGYKFTYVDSTVVKYRQHPNSNTSKKTWLEKRNIYTYLIQKYAMQ